MTEHLAWELSWQHGCYNYGPSPSRAPSSGLAMLGPCAAAANLVRSIGLSTSAPLLKTDVSVSGAGCEGSAGVTLYEPCNTCMN